MSASRHVALGFLAGSSAFAGYFLGRKHEEPDSSGSSSLGELATSVGGSRTIGKKLKDVVNLAGDDSGDGGEDERLERPRVRTRWIRALEKSNALAQKQVERRGDANGRVIWDYNWDQSVQ